MAADSKKARLSSGDRKKTSPSRSGESKKTTNHEQIRTWAEARGGQPATVRRTADDKKKDPGLLRIDFPGYRGKQSLRHISWDDFFKKFDQKHLVFLYQDRTATGRPSRFFKFISQETAGERSRR